MSKETNLFLKLIIRPLPTNSPQGVFSGLPCCTAPPMSEALLLGGDLLPDSRPATADDAALADDTGVAVISLGEFVSCSPLWTDAACKAKELQRKMWEAYFFYQFVKLKYKTQKEPAEMYACLPPGRRPDTVRLKGFPVHWFTTGAGSARDVLSAAFAQFGAIRNIDITRRREHTDVFVQFHEMSAFEEMSLTLHDCELVHEGTRESWPCSVTYDTDGYFTCESIKHRRAKRMHRAEIERRTLAEEEAATRQAASSLRRLREQAIKRQETLEDGYEGMLELLEELKVGDAPEVQAVVSAAHEALQRAETALASGDVARFDRATTRAAQAVSLAEQTVQYTSAAQLHKVPELKATLEKMGALYFLSLLQPPAAAVNVNDGRVTLDTGRAANFAAAAAAAAAATAAAKPLPPDLRGCTVFVPIDKSFFESADTWEHECWGLHVIPGPYRMQDLYTMNESSILTADMTSTLRTSVNAKGSYTVWVGQSRQPRLKARVLASDIRVCDGTILHLIDRILFPET